jgi:membrane fusion protein (multidrug efflux system)
MNAKRAKMMVIGGVAAAVTLATSLLVAPQQAPTVFADSLAQAAELPATLPTPSVADLQRPAVATPMASVTVAPVLAQPSDVAHAPDDALQARGLVRAVREATLSAGMVAQIVAMPFSEGAAFKKGDLLVEFNCDRAQAEQRAAQASMQVEQKTVETNRELEHFNSIGKFDLLISVSKMNKAKAELEALNAQLKQCRIVAPFAGRVIENKLHLHESASVSQPLLRIVDTSNLELDVIVPSQWLQWLRPGAKFAFKVDETGAVSNAVVDRLLPSVDPDSKTIKIIGRVAGNAGDKAIPGMSGTASFQKSGG